MMDDMTARFGWPLMAPGQAQKEMTHNEALALIDLAVQPVVEAIGIDVPPAEPALGAQWLVGGAPTGAWASKAGWLAGWTAGGWRFVAPRERMVVIRRSDGARFHYVGGAWTAPASIALPSGGSVVDAEARAVLDQLIHALQIGGFLAA